jgi:hypothetical protein
VNTLLFLLATAAMIGAAIYLGHQGIVMRRANKIIAGVVNTLTANPPIASFEALAAAGDRLAHELMWEQNREILDRWWDLRGGHDRCTACRPGEERPR